jgi:hypothetical protein
VFRVLMPMFTGDGAGPAPAKDLRTQQD